MNIIEFERKIEQLRIEAERFIKENPLNDYWIGKLTGLEQVLSLLKIYLEEKEK